MTYPTAAQKGLTFSRWAPEYGKGSAFFRRWDNVEELWGADKHTQSCGAFSWRGTNWTFGGVVLPNGDVGVTVGLP